MEGTSTDSFQMFTGTKSSQTSLINNWGFVFITVPELSLRGEEVKAWSLCGLVCLVTEDKPWLALVWLRKETVPQRLAPKKMYFQEKKKKNTAHLVFD